MKYLGSPVQAPRLAANGMVRSLGGVIEMKTKMITAVAALALVLTTASAFARPYNVDNGCYFGGSADTAKAHAAGDTTCRR